MARLSTASRRKLKSSQFAGPGRSYPVNDKAHARAAKSRAAGAYHRGRLTARSLAHIDRKADRVLHRGARRRSGR